MKGRLFQLEGPLKEKAHSAWKFFNVWNTEDAIVSRREESCQQKRRECMMGLQFKEIRSIRRSSASYHIEANCSNLVFFSAFYRQSVQIYKKGCDMFVLGSLADKMSSTVHHTLNFVKKFLRNTNQQGITVISMREYKGCDKNFCGLSSKELMNQSNAPDLKVCGLAKSVDMLLHGEATVKHDT